MTQVSIIIPIYNVAQYVERCLVSVMKQSCQNIECLLIDDCGTDDSIFISEKLINNYTGPIQFHILHHQHNRGLSAARNTGIMAAKGDYIFFLDSDDWISADCIQKMVDTIEEDNGIEMVMGGIQKMDENIKWEGFLPYGKYTSNFIEYACSYSIYSMAWNKLIRLDFIKKNNLFFEEGLLHEDLLWNIQVACYLKKMVSIEDVTYYYLTNRNNSIQNNESELFYLKHLGNVIISLIHFVFEKGFRNNKTLYYYITNDIPRFICTSKPLAKSFYNKIRLCPFWSFSEQSFFGTSKRMIVINLHRLLPKALGFHYYRTVYKLLKR